MKEANLGGAGAVMTTALDTLWTKIILADSAWNPDRSCFQLAEEFRLNGRSVDQNVKNFIRWQVAKASGTGFLLGLPGLAFGFVTIPADLTATAYFQLRMIAVIALLHGWDVRSERLRTLAFLSLLGSGAGEAVRGVGVQVGTKLTASMVKQIPGRLLIDINKAVGFRLVTKAGTQGVINLIKFVPIMGGLVSGGLNAASTRAIGAAAQGVLRGGPDEAADTTSRRSPEIEGVAEPAGT